MCALICAVPAAYCCYFAAAVCVGTTELGHHTYAQSTHGHVNCQLYYTLRWSSTAAVY
jgi:hypothetical protein